ncbi:alpha/beta hydrolase family protein [Pseudactinotalea terrae]|uniref:alpha/beta hydrolase family protein n=1 Tax=Pseudactinotalea terrae TaxID=1743262 RepID=UPI0012E16793|nr:acetylxylan esterase [Pseudactinotalea terrae]
MATALGWNRNLDGHHDVSLDLLLHVNRRTEQVLAQTAVGLDEAHDAEAIRARQRATREAVLAGIGGLPERPDGPPRTTWRGPQRMLGCVVENLVFDSLPGVPVTATLYRPTSGDGPRPALLFVCGHTPDGRANPGYQQVCARLAQAGMVVLAIDPFGQGERLGYLDAEGTPQVPVGTAEHTYAGIPAWLLGQSITRWFVHDARRAVDLLQTLPDVDADRIGVTGNSGGGTLTTWLLPLEDRFAAAAPGTFVTSRGVYLWSGQSQDAEQILPGGTANGVDHADLLVSFAPRPLAVLAVDFDFFPMEGTLESFERARRAYAVLDAEQAISLHSAASTHAYPPPLAHDAATFFCQAFGLPAPALAPTEEPAPADRMRAMPSGQVAIDRPGSQFVHDLVRAEADALTRPAPEAARAWLTERVRAHRAMPRAPFARWLPRPQESLHGMWRSERDVWGAGVLLAADPAPTVGPRPLRLLLLDSGTDGLTTDHPAARGGTEAVLAIDVRGRGALAPHDKDGNDARDHRSAVFKLLCDLLWLDDSLAAGQAFDITRAIDVALHDPHLATLLPGLGTDSPVHIEADGVPAFVAKLAAVVDDRIATLTVTDDVVDPERMLTERLYDQGRGEWQSTIVGLARHAPLRVVHEILGDRLQLS